MRDIVLLGARISAGIVFSLVPAGWLGQSGANLVDAAESILQTSKPASEAHPRSVTFSGEVLKGRSFEKTIRANLFFRLVPQELGWTILIGSKADAANNFCGVVQRRTAFSLKPAVERFSR
jgi:hypothetical protein